MFKKPNLKGPRFRKDEYHVFRKDLFDRFKEKYPQHSITFDKFESTITNHSGKMWKEAIDSRDGILLPEGIGTVFVISTKITRKKNVNIQASVLANREILHRNWNTDGYVAKITFTSFLNRSFNTVDTGLWFFRGHRDFKRSVAKEYPKDWKKYIVSRRMKGAAQIYKDEQIKHFLKKKVEEDLKTYNEFE